MVNLMIYLIRRKSAHFVVFIAAFIFGALLACIWRSIQCSPKYPQSSSHKLNHQSHLTKNVKISRLIESNYSQWLRDLKLSSDPQLIAEGITSHNLQVTKSSSQEQNIPLESEYLKKQIPILCLIWSKSRNLANAIKLTWGKSCNKLYFIASYSDSKLDIISYSSLEPSHVSFCKILIKLRIKLKDLQSLFKWIILAQDSSFVIVENARHLVASLNHSSTFYLGRPAKMDQRSPIHNRLDSTIILSIGSINHIYDNFFINLNSCQVKVFNVTGKNNSIETVVISRQMEWSLAEMLNSVALPVDVSDDSGSKFLPMSLMKHLIPGEISPYNPIWRQDVTSVPTGPRCCSNNLISFNDLTPTHMFLTNYILYHLNVFTHSYSGFNDQTSIVDSSIIHNSCDDKVPSHCLQKSSIDTVSSDNRTVSSSAHRSFK